LLTKPIPRFLFLGAICLLAILPFFRWGSPSGHDFEFHMFSWMDVASQWQEGIVFPRWAAMAHWGYGEPRFLFYPPASWMLGGALGSLLPWRAVPGAYCWLALVAAGAAMYKAARRWLPPQDAFFAAAFYALNPYSLLIVYWRSAYAELLSAALLPLLLPVTLCLDDGSFVPTLCLGLIFAGGWLTNIPAAVMIHYSAAGLAVLMALTHRSARPLVRTAMGVVLGAGLASFYLIPVIHEQHWINLEEVFSPGVRPQDNFLFTILADPDHNRFNLLVSLIALSEIAALALVVVFSRRKRARGDGWLALASWGTAAAFLMLPISQFAWDHLPQFRFVQLPFRWLLSMNVAVALLLAMAGQNWRRWIARVAACICLVAVIVLAGRSTQPPWWDTGFEIRQMEQSVRDGSGYEGTDEYAPAGADPYELKRDLPRLSDENGAAVDAHVLTWGPTEKHFQVQAEGSQAVTVRLFHYPAWRVFVNGHPVTTETTEVTGLMVVPVEAGANDVWIVFARTRDREIGMIVSLLSMVVLVVAWVLVSSRSARRKAGGHNREMEK
jgi:hypothetical protein